MKKGICPKCQSKEVFSGAEIKSKSGFNHANTIPITTFSYVKLDNYVCFNCGYLESYIGKSEDLDKIAKKWPLAREIY